MKQSGLSDYIIAILELFEAEGRALKKESLRVAYSFGFILAGIGILLISAGFLLWALYSTLSVAYGDNIGALITAGLGMLLSILLFVIASWQSR